MARKYLLLSNRNRLIPRIEVTCRRRSAVKTDPDNPFENGSLMMQYEEFIAVECTVQPMRGKAARDQNNQLQVEGEVDYDSYTVYSETILHRAREGTNDYSDQMLLPDSVGENTWFTVMKADRFVSSGVPRYRYYLIAVPEGTEGGM
ncbi:hypothetical protein [Salmonella phage SSBI34]|nr:hypothetical protein [Salmonella phage SSBI34]